MHPILIKIGPLNIYSYGVMVALGFAFATFFIYRQAPQFGVNRERTLDLALFMLIGGLIGARLLYIALNIDYYQAHPFEIADLSKGGLVWYGGFAGGLLAAAWCVVKNGLDFWNVADLVAPYLLLAQSFGRIGCFLNGCCFGAVVQDPYPFGVLFPGALEYRHPTQLYSSAALFLLFLILKFWQKRRRFVSEIFLGYCILYALKRFFMEFLRGDNPRIIAHLTMSQLVSALVLAVSSLIFIYKASEWKRTLR